MTLAVSGASVRIGAATLLDDVSLALAPREILAIVGPNGAGKSTLLGLLAGDRSPTGGTVTLDGRPMATLDGRALATRRAVMAAESPMAFAFSAEEVALLGRMPHHGGRPGPQDRAVVAALLEALDCGPLAGRTYATLSSGERQRVQLARAIAQVSVVEAGAEAGSRADPGSGTASGAAADTGAAAASGAAAAADTDPASATAAPDLPARFLLLDEPTASLDPGHQHAALRLVRATTRTSVGVAVVLHDLDLAARYADRVALLHRGRLRALDTPDRVLRAEVLEPVFGIALLELRDGRLRHTVVVADEGAGAVARAAAGPPGPR